MTTTTTTSMNTSTQPSIPPNPNTNNTTDTDTDKLSITVEFTGGLEMLFNNDQRHEIQIPSATVSTVRDLIPWLCANLMADSRRELFVLGDGSVRPGILVLINDADWELEGEDKYEIQEGDRIMFVSTLHGG